jgi:hypothetical protein
MPPSAAARVKAQRGPGVAEPGQVAEREPLHRARIGILPAQRQVPSQHADRVQRHPAQPQRGDVHARPRRQPQPPRVAAGQVAEQVHAGVARAHHEHIQACHLRGVAELPGMDHDAAEARHPRPAGHDRLGIWPGGDHRVRGRDAAPAQPQLPAVIGPVDPVDPRTQSQPHLRGVVLQVGHIVVASRKRPAAAGDPSAGLMREHPVSIQPEMVMAVLPGCSHRVCLVHHERINAGPADRPGSRQSGRARADDHDMLIHGASVYPFPARRQQQPARPRQLTHRRGFLKTAG